MDLFIIILVALSLLLAIQAGYTLYLMLYTWNDKHLADEYRSPKVFREPELSFTVLLPAKNEEEVIQGTIQRVLDIDYPSELVEIFVILQEVDTGTIEQVELKLAELEAQGITNVRMITFNEPPFNKPHGLNIGLRQATKDVVTIFDAEDEPHRDILNIINTTMLNSGASVVQSGVQLMNYQSTWFSALNVLEYYFWFKSRLHFHAKAGMIPLGGNTVFVTRELLDRLGGWGDTLLTEDADMGLRCSLMGEKIKVIYSDEHVTQEETPPSLTQFVKQRTRWNQGFLEILIKGDWKQLSTLHQRFLAFYTLAFSFFQALTGLYFPVSIYMMFFYRTDPVAALFLALPFYMVIASTLFHMVGLRYFVKSHNLKLKKRALYLIPLFYFPYQWALSFAAIRAVYRHVTGQNNWEKTKHIGAHRQQPKPASASGN
ncbi:MAG TPA: glycosyltransferase [Chloroflexia bacterium]|nr:glycosyltransferase [Chloroflexia bacterium]